MSSAICLLAFDAMAESQESSGSILEIALIGMKDVCGYYNGLCQFLNLFLARYLWNCKRDFSARVSY